MLTQQDTRNISIHLTESLWKVIYNPQTSIETQGLHSWARGSCFSFLCSLCPWVRRRAGRLALPTRPDLPGSRPWEPRRGWAVAAAKELCQRLARWAASRACLHGCAKVCSPVTSYGHAHPALAWTAWFRIMLGLIHSAAVYSIYRS